MNEPKAKHSSSLRVSLLLAASIGFVAVIVYVATFGHAPSTEIPFCALAAVWTATAAIAPIWLESLLINGASFQLAVVTWRMFTMLGALAIAQTFQTEARNYFLTTLMACYFVALPLESWLLARSATK